ncbi:hypothetical protein C1637_18270 [Chryseobacterium lactis]|uniref:Uncharacterized protein n=1 Tax=Chryseobacterium lactis TaxID=1241981 RepID=A0A3G6RJH5_CHRLC|nr:hypothetical protein [Chryseobacterium lactis]AZA84732.1 hypothetical protein EG342_23780 [Chryseobacterium lactis]AZB05121.1 hypothetical protein EG341_14660 [Chryseobacterium lactis]PNW12103.1 hypothetical protein C1637_18270 [Chryseobacterium lactis]
MKSNLIFSLVLLVGLVSCTSKKARDFRKEITDKEQIVFKALVDTTGYETEKSQNLIKRNFDEALSSINKEEKFFDSVIKDLSAIPTDNIKDAAPVKTAAINYYKALKDLFILDRLSIEQQKITFTNDIKKVDKASDSILQITRKKLELHTVANARSQDLQKALEIFDKTNHLK